MSETREAQPLTPARFCQFLLTSLEAARSRRKRRKRDTGPDMIGMELKRYLLQAAIEVEPSPDEFEAWLMEQVIASDTPGPVRAMAIEILADYQNACADPGFEKWLEAAVSAPSGTER